VAALCATGPVAAGGSSITILSTTDLHGNIYPIDYATDQPDERGLAKVATLVRRVRAETPNVLLIDCGDALAGTALSHFHATRAATAPNPVISAMNVLGVDAMVVGNHEYDFVWTVLERARREARFPWLAANVSVRGANDIFFRPYVLKTIAGVRVGILGLSTTANPNWDDPARYLSKIEIRDPLEQARRWVHELRGRERADLVAVAMHMGLEEDAATGARRTGQSVGENEALAIARNVPGIDVLLMGHTHMEVPSLVVNGVLMTQAAAWGRSLARVDLTVEPVEKGWRVISKTAHTVSIAGVPPDPQVLADASGLHRATERWLNTPVGESGAEQLAGEERFHDTPLLDFVQTVQLQAGNAHVSLAESLNPTAYIPKGTVTIRHLFGLYGVEKKLVTLEMTGRQLRAVLEQSAHYFRGSFPGGPPSAWIDADFPPYDYYVAEGVTYALDLSRPLGSRIVDLRYRGAPVGDSDVYRVATSNYLANGAAEYSMLGTAKVVARSTVDLRELLVQWLRRNRRLPETSDGNWRLLPQ